MVAAHEERERGLETELQEARQEANQELNQEVPEGAQLRTARSNSPGSDKPRKTEVRTKGSVLKGLTLDMSADGPPLSEQIANALKANSTRVIDLFRECAQNAISRHVPARTCTWAAHARASS